MTNSRSESCFPAGSSDSNWDRSNPRISHQTAPITCQSI